MMTRNQLPPVVRRWRFFAAVVGVTALAGGGVLMAAASDPATAMAFHPVTTTRVLRYATCNPGRYEEHAARSR